MARPFIVRKLTPDNQFAYMLLNGPFEYATWWAEPQYATQMPMWKACQYANIYDAQAVPLQ